jgi:hypothetical protein
MPVMDDEFLSTLFLQAADSFEVPAGGAAEILRQAGGDEPPGPTAAQATFDLGPDDAVARRRSIGGAIRSHRLLAAAAVVVLVGAVAGSSLWLGSRSPAPTGSTQAVRGSAVPTTTEPVSHGTSSAGKSFSSVAAPTSAPSTSRYGLSTGSAASAAPTSASTSGGVTSLKAAQNASSLPSGDAVGQSSEIEQTGALSLRVAKGALSSTMAQLTALAATYHGFVANSQTQSSPATPGTAPSGSITLQVPVASFATVVKGAQSLGKSLQLTTQATDVTGKYVDLQSQITALQDSLQQYLTILTKAQSIGDILAVQAQVQSLQTQIQQLQGQLAVLTNETAYSTLTVTVREPGRVAGHHPAPRRPTGFDRAWHNSLHGFADGAEGVVSILGPLLFGLILLGLVLLAGRLSWRRWQRHNL